MVGRVNYASVRDMSAPMYSEFATEFLLRRFSSDVVSALHAALPVYSRGPRRGKLKGQLRWMRCERGGWTIVDNVGRVLRPGAHRVRVFLGEICLLDEWANATDESRIAGIASAAERARRAR